MRKELMTEFRQILADKNHDLPKLVIANLRNGQSIFCIDMGEDKMNRLFGIMQEANVEASISELNQQFSEWEYPFHNQRAEKGEKWEIWTIKMDWNPHNWGTKCIIEVKFERKSPHRSNQKVPTTA
tara:strand:+ start:622 stop:999 length:378 start_codon:yes stop_codon:yes gene_type:complete